MFRNYLKIAWRNIWKNKQVSAVNITGLAVAIAAALLLCITVYREFSFDDFHEKKESLYQVYREEFHADGTESHSNMSYPMGPAMKAELPGIRELARLANGAAVMKVGETSQSIGLRYVDSSFLDLFTFPVAAGSGRLDMNTALISEKMAGIFFKDADPLGKTVLLRAGPEWKSFTVGGVMKDPPNNSSIRFDALVRLETHRSYLADRGNWGNFSLEIFVQLSPGVHPEDIERRGKAFMEKYYEEDVQRMKAAGAVKDKFGGVLHLGLIPLNEIHFSKHSNLQDAKKPILYMLLFIAGFLLFIASINFLNLTLARAFTRAKEVGMRKTLGAATAQLVLQLCGEALVLFLISLALGLVITYFVLPHYNALFFSNSVYAFGILFKPKFLAGIFVALLLITLLAGGYPAWALSRTHTLLVLKGKVSAGRTNYFRNSLIVTQFVFSCLLICGTIVAWQQMSYLHNKPLGFNTHEVVSIPVSKDVNGHQLLARLRAELAGQPDILSITASGNNFGRGKDGAQSTSIINFQLFDKDVKSHWQSVDFDYVKTMDLQLVGGKDFDRSMGLDSLGLVINEKMAKQLAALGVKDPVGYRFRMDGEGPEYHINGVVKDYNFKSLHEEIAPLTLYLNRPEDLPAYIFVKTGPGNLTASMAKIEAAYKKTAPGQLFLASFVNENTEKQYKFEAVLMKIFVSGAILTIIISCMGLFAIAMLAIGHRTKEIGIRKVLGASAAGIAGLIAADFLKLVLIAIVIATPVAWYVTREWLKGYAYQVDVGWWVFVLAGLLAILIAAATVSFQSIRAALMNPVKSLRSE